MLSPARPFYGRRSHALDTPTSCGMLVWSYSHAPIDSRCPGVNAREAALRLGVSARQVYDLAAPNGPIACMRIGRRVVFEEPDIEEYKKQCRFIVTANAVSSSLSSTVVSPVRVVSGLESAFQKLGLKPKLTPSIERSPRGCTRSQAERKDLTPSLKTPLPST